jgi:hypothetical protein
MSPGKFATDLAARALNLSSDRDPQAAQSFRTEQSSQSTSECSLQIHAKSVQYVLLQLEGAPRDLIAFSECPFRIASPVTGQNSISPAIRTTPITTLEGFIAMFSYSDPTGTGFLHQNGALQVYRDKVRDLDVQFNALAKSGYTLRQAFEELTPGNVASVTSVNWKAFPITHNVPFNEIDTDRFGNQDEYAEWRVEKKPDNTLARVTFTTEFSEYFEALAAVSVDALRTEIQNLYPGANLTDQELFGAGFNPATASPNARRDRFSRQLRNNPWNNGQKGILCLAQRFNTLSALFNLLGQCGIPNTKFSPDDLCSHVGGACGPGPQNASTGIPKRAASGISPPSSRNMRPCSSTSATCR